MTRGGSECVSDRTELIHPTGRHTNKASASSTCFSGLLWVFVRQPDFDSSTLHGHQHPHRHLVECGFQWDWFYIESAFITAPKMTALLEGVCRVILEEEQRRMWATHRLLGPSTHTFSTVSEPAGAAVRWMCS